jgi:hypothetical protein
MAGTRSMVAKMRSADAFACTIAEMQGKAEPSPSAPCSGGEGREEGGVSVDQGQLRLRVLGHRSGRRCADGVWGSWGWDAREAP